MPRPTVFAASNAARGSSYWSTGAWPEGAVRPASFMAAAYSSARSTKPYSSTAVNPIPASRCRAAGKSAATASRTEYSWTDNG